jgi:hypothetical protein
MLDKPLTNIDVEKLTYRTTFMSPQQNAGQDHNINIRNKTLRHGKFKTLGNESNKSNLRA